MIFEWLLYISFYYAQVQRVSFIPNASYLVLRETLLHFNMPSTVFEPNMCIPYFSVHIKSKRRQQKENDKIINDLRSLFLV